jgi:hypothetical protein
VVSFSYYYYYYYLGGARGNMWVRHCDASRKVTGSRPDEISEFLHLILPAAIGPGYCSAYNRNEFRSRKKIMFLESRARPVRRADFTAICEPIF